ncbi:hypothetical protein SAMN04488121_103879 [Chitinophaga filiformis]|uniref:Uncharacterized protein n=1 Tax=Chitinophaga filiformis TaxID=104663 RepID=A0A1G7SHP5_CHIFI|nr:hypothetical protein SAMN04488121_103879 [Chitinophaga filiformis]
MLSNECNKKLKMRIDVGLSGHVAYIAQISRIVDID